MDDEDAPRGPRRKRPTRLEQMLRGTESQLRYAGNEIAYVFAPDGERILTVIGGPSQIVLTVAEVRLCAGNVITHSHPHGGSFSKDDLEFASRAGVLEYRAVSRDHIYAMKPPEDGWGDVSTRNRYVAEYERAQREVYAMMVVGALHPMASHVSGIETASHAVMLRVGRRTGIRYTRGRWRRRRTR